MKTHMCDCVFMREKDIRAHMYCEVCIFYALESAHAPSHTTMTLLSSTHHRRDSTYELSLVVGGVYTIRN